MTIVRFRKELISELVKQGFDVWISFPNYSHGESESGEEAAKRLNCNFIEFKMDRRSASLFKEIKTFKECRKIIKKIKPDCVLTFTVKPDIYGGFVSKKEKIPYIVNVTGLGSGFTKRGLFKNVLLCLMKMSMSRAEVVFFQNTENRDYFYNCGYNKENYRIIPGSGVNLEEFKPLPYVKDGFYFLYMARVMREKGIDEFLYLANIFKEYSDVEFHICGDMEEDYEVMIKDYVDKGIITYHGIVENVVDYIKKASAIVHPSFYNEGISNTLLEAAACARPILTTNHVGCRDVVDDGVSGLVFAERNAEDLLEKTKYFMALSPEDRERMGLRGRDKVERSFGREIVLHEYIQQIYRCLQINT